MDRDRQQNEEFPVEQLDYLISDNLNRLWSSIIVNGLIKSGITHFFISPGLRNAPLIAAIEKRKETFNSVGIDERAQAYQALGYAKSTGSPAVLVCTSGTALANYYPAVIEAFKTKTPLIILSADRPIESVRANDNQTIEQRNIYAQFARPTIDLGTPNEEISPIQLSSIVSHGVYQSISNNIPVHFNCPFREPVDQTPSSISNNYLKLSLDYLKNYSFKEIYNPEQKIFSSKTLEEIKTIFKMTKKGIIVVGELPSHMEKEGLINFIRETKWPVYLDVTSSIKYSFNLDDGIIPSFDHPEVFDKIKSSNTQTIIHIGGRLTSKHYYTFLKNNPQIMLASIDDNHSLEDPSYKINRFFKGPVQDLNKLIPLETNTETFLGTSIWRDFVCKKEELIENSPLSYPVVSKKLIEIIPEGSHLYLGNSTVIRSFDSYISKDKRKNINIISHRGASGIEGFLAAACGSAQSHDGLTTLVLGDVSFIHDLNSMLLIRDLKPNLKIILVNNNGGKIFSLLPISSDKAVIPYLETQHDLQFKKIIESFSINYYSINSKEEFEKTYTNAIKQKGPEILELLIDNEKSSELYGQLKTIKL